MSDAASPSVLIARYIALEQPRLRGFIRSSVFNPSDVDDVLQDVAAAAMESVDRYDPSRPIEAWVFGIARIHVLRYLDRHRAGRVVFNSGVVELLSVDAIAEATTGLRQDRLESLRRCLHTLPADRRDLVIRRHRPGTTARQLAQEIGYTDSRMSRLLASLYRTLLRCVENSVAIQ